ncbi:MAG: HAD-IIB family hydrolase [Polyangia bacterium]|jgi:HAD superfamily hydrolase (TIGR01484 family)|nr:HAD-IIB family hydrolase [Polyangia bacterium]
MANDLSRQPRPLAELPKDLCQGLLGLCTDIDDTLTTRGKLTAEAYRALWAAHDAGLLVIPVTGRPAGWADHLARMWPVDGVVAENGALYLRHRDGRLVRRTVRGDRAMEETERERLLGLAQKVLAEVPGAALSSDQPYREFDVAVDFCEDVSPLPGGEVDRILAIFRAGGAMAKVSSIHVNAWFGSYDKLGMLERLLREEHGHDLEDPAVAARFLFVGDSPNDEPMFRFFPFSVGVANLAAMAPRMTHLPSFITAKPSGEGFAELVEHILGHRP